MKTKRGKTKKLPSEVTPATSLPPLVEGQPRCFLRIRVGALVWSAGGAGPRVSTLLHTPLVRLRWWGEGSGGTIFRPHLAGGTRSPQSFARFSVCCGPKQFSSYLSDMGNLVLEVLAKLEHLPVGRVHINHISRLSATQPISGSFPILSSTSHKLGELQVSMTLEALADTSDGRNSVPTTDMSVNGHHGDASAPLALVHASVEGGLASVEMDPSTRRLSLQSSSGHESAGSSLPNTPRGKDHLYFQSGHKGTTGNNAFNLEQVSHSGLLVSPNKEQPSSTEANQQPGYNQDQQAEEFGGTQNTADVISVLLDRGRRLRDAMVVSSMHIDPPHSTMNAGPTETFSHTGTSGPSPTPSVKLLRNLLNADDFHAHGGKGSQPPSLRLLRHGATVGPDTELRSEPIADTEMRAVELLLGSSDMGDLSALGYWDGTGSMPDTPLSERGGPMDESDINGPLHDQSLLEDLFYRGLGSSGSQSEAGSGEETRSRRLGGKGPQGDVDRDVPPPETSHPSSLRQSRPDGARRQPPPSQQQLGLDLEAGRLALLGRVHLARVVVGALHLPGEAAAASPSRHAEVRSSGKPPRPRIAAGKKCTYFVEYHFPVPTNVKDASGQTALMTEVTRVASSKIIGGAVRFQQRSVFPVFFGGEMLRHWWNTELLFRVYARRATQRKAALVGTAHLPLRTVMQSEQLSVSASLGVESIPSEDGAELNLGPLKVSIELAADSKDFTQSMSKPAGGNKHAAYTVTSPGPSVRPADAQPHQAPLAKRLDAGGPVRSLLAEFDSSTKPMQPGGRSSNNNNEHVYEEPENVQGPLPPLLLHALLLVADGKRLYSPSSRLSGGSAQQEPSSAYLVCKLFSSQEVTRSAVCWSSATPLFNYSQVSPVQVTPQLLERMNNNVMVIEVWNKEAGPGPDQLIGLAKLPLHHFHMSFRDPNVSRLLLEAQYPVVAVDGYMPVVDVFSGSRVGELRALLAMGSSNQVLALQRLKGEEVTSVPTFHRAARSMGDSAAQPSSSQVPLQEPEQFGLREEHVFEVHVGSVRGLVPLQSGVWGEADCYVQYHFPAQPNVDEPGLSMCAYRTATTLCVPDPVFRDTQTHALVASPGEPVQRLLLEACSRQGGPDSPGGGGIHFEVWCRYYYPNVREQLVARGTLPLAKLCAMVTLQRRGEAGAQAFSLPLKAQTAPGHHPPHPSAGLLELSVAYKHRPITGPTHAEPGASPHLVTLALTVHRAMGLQAAARLAAERDPSMHYPAEAGVNACVSLGLSLAVAAAGRENVTRAVARSFSPEFEHGAEVACHVVSRGTAGESRSLAETLCSAQAIFTLVHQNSRGRSSDAARARGAVLGVTRVPLAALLSRTSGIHGWFPVSPAGVGHGGGGEAPDPLNQCVGGLELSVAFAHAGDREKVLQAARYLGWKHHCMEQEEEGDAMSEEAFIEATVVLKVAVPKAWLPERCLPDFNAPSRPAPEDIHCYLRYRLYDAEAVCSRPRRPQRSCEDGAALDLHHARTFRLPLARPLRWYMREERLELQLWASGAGQKIGSRSRRPHDTDRLIGSAFVDLSSLVPPRPQRHTQNKCTVSGVYPLFKYGADDLAGAALRVHVTSSLDGRHVSGDATPHAALPSDGEATDDDEEEEDDDDGYNDRDATNESGWKRLRGDNELDGQGRSRGAKRDIGKCGTTAPSEDEAADSFPALVMVERAMHLSCVGSPRSRQGAPPLSFRVSYAVCGAAEPVFTEAVGTSSSPVWEHHLQTRLSTQLLLDPRQSLVFKVWHSTGQGERALGFASVDLSALLSGFQSVCGWYNVVDVNGQCRGQIKVAVTPTEGVVHLRAARWQHADTVPVQPKSRGPHYQTTAVYSMFPSHISRFPEQHISTSATLNHRATAAGVGTSRSRFREHRDNVRRFHQSLQQPEGSAPGEASGPTHAESVGSNGSSGGSVSDGSGDSSEPAKSTLLKSLRKNLRELDDMQRFFTKRLSVVPDPWQRQSEGPRKGTVGEQSHPLCTGGTEPTGTSGEMHDELLEKSSRLVSEVNSLMCGLHGAAGTALPPSTQEPVFEENADSVEPALLSDRSTTAREHEPADSWDPVGIGDHLLPISFDAETPMSARMFTNAAELASGSLSAEDDDFRRGEHYAHQIDGFDDIIGTGVRDFVIGSASDYGDGDFDEHVVEPRTLNDISVITDKTSPWSSVVSDPESHAHGRPRAEYSLTSLIPSEEGTRRNTSSPEQPTLTAAPDFEQIDTDPAVMDDGEISRLASVGLEELGPESSENYNTPIPSQGMHSQNNDHCALLEVDINDEQFDDARADADADVAASSVSAAASVISERQTENTLSENEETDHGESEGTRESHGSSSSHSDQERTTEKRVGQIVSRDERRAAASDEHSSDEEQEAQGIEEVEESDLNVPGPEPLPNFFLPPRDLEASMRALRLAPVFPAFSARKEGEIGTSGANARRTPRLQAHLAPSLPPDQTKRIAKIFSSRYSKPE
ncbi:C2 domain-containing protein 3 isoform X1 [Lampetra fluviatilis]